MNIRCSNIIPIPMADSVGNSDIWRAEREFVSGNIYHIIAPSGTGKTSFVSILFGIRKDYTGTVFFDNQNIAHIPLLEWANIRRNKVSMVFQGLGLFPELTTLENIALKNKLTQHKTSAEIHTLISRLGLQNHIHKPAAILSFGQQQRVALIRALCQPFECLLLDEPFSHLDSENATICMHIIEEELQQQNAIGILTSLENKYYSNQHHVLNL